MSETAATEPAKSAPNQAKAFSDGTTAMVMTAPHAVATHRRETISQRAFMI